VSTTGRFGHLGGSLLHAALGVAMVTGVLHRGLAAWGGAAARRDDATRPPASPDLTTVRHA
jgi:hypothetical protein